MPTHDAVSAQITNTSATVSWTHTPVGTPTGVAVAFGWVDNGGQTITSVKYDAGGAGEITLSQLGTTQASSFWKTAIFGSTSTPPAGAKTVTITFSGALSHGCSAYAETVTGGNTTALYNGTGSSNNTGNISDTVTCASGDVVIDICTMNALNVTSYGQSAINQGGLGGSSTGPTSGIVFGSRIVASGSTQAMTEVLTGSNNFAHSAAAFQAPGAGGGSTGHPQFLNLLGVA